MQVKSPQTEEWERESREDCGSSLKTEFLSCEMGSELENLEPETKKSKI